MDKELVRVENIKKIVKISENKYSNPGDLDFSFCSNGYQSTVVCLSPDMVEMLRSALDQLTNAN